MEAGPTPAAAIPGARAKRLRAVALVGLATARGLLGPAVVLATLGPLTSWGADGPPSPAWRTSAGLRSRLEAWNWFDPGPVARGRQDEYVQLMSLLRVGRTFKGRRQSGTLELGLPVFVGVPDDAVAAGAAGQLGLGGTVRAVNGGRGAALFLKQGFAVLEGRPFRGASLTLGRFEFGDGTESLTGDPALDWIKRQRIAERILGSFGFSYVQRSFDGLRIARDTPRSNLTLVAVRPTVGAFDLDANESLSDVSVLYGAWTRKGGARRADLRLFGAHYEDGRRLAKVDNRAAATRAAERSGIQVHTLGGHGAWRMGQCDGLLWVALQGGDWGGQRHRAWAWDVELGWQPPRSRLKPWLRMGVYRGSGDGDPSDRSHGTFFTMLPTARLYARFPFFNAMNLEDVWVSLILRPTARVTVRAEAHDLDLEDARDLWYLGGGAFNRGTFGYVGRPSGGSGDLATLLDLGLDWKLSSRASLGLYLSRALGGGVPRATYPAGADAAFSYLELARTF